AAGAGIREGLALLVTRVLLIRKTTAPSTSTHKGRISFIARDCHEIRTVGNQHLVQAEWTVQRLVQEWLRIVADCQPANRPVHERAQRRDVGWLGTPKRYGDSRPDSGHRCMAVAHERRSTNGHYR